jgi:hypothetical protein
LQSHVYPLIVELQTVFVAAHLKKQKKNIYFKFKILIMNQFLKLTGFDLHGSISVCIKEN